MLREFYTTDAIDNIVVFGFAIYAQQGSIRNYFTDMGPAFLNRKEAQIYARSMPEHGVLRVVGSYEKDTMPTDDYPSGRGIVNDVLIVGWPVSAHRKMMQLKKIITESHKNGLTPSEIRKAISAARILSPGINPKDIERYIKRRFRI